jgi:hypothetical protein
MDHEGAWVRAVRAALPGQVSAVSCATYPESCMRTNSLTIVARILPSRSMFCHSFVALCCVVGRSVVRRSWRVSDSAAAARRAAERREQPAAAAAAARARQGLRLPVFRYPVFCVSFLLV